MEYLPLFVRMQGKKALLIGNNETLTRKHALLKNAGMEINLVADAPCQELIELIDSGVIKKTADTYSESLLENVSIVVCSNEDGAIAQRVSNDAMARELPVNIVNNTELSSFIFPSVIDRSPIVAAVSSGGQIPVMTRILRNLVESTLPFAYGRLAQLSSGFRLKVNAQYPALNQRRRFWEKHLAGYFAELVFSGRDKEAEAYLEDVIGKESMSETGEVYLVGAGPGDPDLLTFRALRLIRQADVVVYDRLVSTPILELARQDAEKIHVGKERSNHTLPQEKINQLLVRLAKEGKRVVRLKGGDPFIFGRGGEEIEELAASEVPFQVVPGITAASGCSSYSGIPLTHRDYSQSVRFITGHLKDGSCDLPWQEFVTKGQTLVFYMGLTGLDVICSELISCGMDGSTPLALISKGTTPEQKVLTTTVEDATKAVKNVELKAPTLIIIGEVVRLREKLRWFD